MVGLANKLQRKRKFNDGESNDSTIEQETRLSEKNLASIVKVIKTKLSKDDLYGSDINNALQKIC